MPSECCGGTARHPLSLLRGASKAVPPWRDGDSHPKALCASKKPAHNDQCHLFHPAGLSAPPSRRDPGNPDPKEPTGPEQAMPGVTPALPLRKKTPKTAAAKEHPEFYLPSLSLGGGGDCTHLMPTHQRQGTKATPWARIRGQFGGQGGSFLPKTRQ